MATTVQSLVDRIADTLGNYGDASTPLAAQATASDTTLTIADAAQMPVPGWVLVDFEMMYVTAVATGPPSTITARRGQRGSTAVSHANGAIVWVNPVWGTQAILNQLNAAVGAVRKTVTDTSLTAQRQQWQYLKPDAVGCIYRLEMESGAAPGNYAVNRDWDMVDAYSFRLYGDYDPGLHIKLIGKSSFDPMVPGGNLDADWPDDSVPAMNYLYYYALGQLELDRQARIARRDSFEGLTDPFAANMPDQSIRTARFYQAEAQRYLKMALDQNEILQPIEDYVPHPSRRYFSYL